MYFDSLLDDISYGLRTMARNPGITAARVLTLALGIGATTAMFSILDAVLLRTLPYRDPDRLVAIRAQVPHLNVSAALVEYHIYAEWWRARSRSFEAWSAFAPGSANLTLGDQPERVSTVRVTAGFLSMLGVRPALGREFLPHEDQPGGPPVAILSDSLWRRRFGAAEIVGRQLLLDRRPYTVVGVLAPGFDLYGADVSVYLPLAASTARAPGMPSVGVLARLRSGVSLAAAQADIDDICRAWTARYPYPKDWGAHIWTIRGFLVRDVRSTVVMLSVAVGLVLLIACANVANLLMARAAARVREIAIRAALGAGRGRIVRQLLTESALLAGLAALIGLLAAWIGLRAFAAAPALFPLQQTAAVDLRVLGFAIGVAALTTLLFGLAPSLAAACPRLARNLKQGGRGGGEGVIAGRFRSALAVFEIALSLTLVLGATLTVSSLVRLQAVDPGFQPGGVLTGSFTLPSSNYGAPEPRAAFLRSLTDRLEHIPGVTAAGAVSHLPFSSSKSGSVVRVEGGPAPRPGESPIVFQRAADPAYFAAIGCRLVRGRLFDRHDPPGHAVAVINQTMARRCWPNQEPVGKRFGDGAAEHWMTVVGVIADMRQTSLADQPDAESYVPYARTPVPAMSLVVRTTVDPMRLAPAIRAALRELDPDLPLSGISALSDSLAASTRARRFSVAVLVSFALLSLLLAAIGISGVISYSVARRTHEIGIRIALGAEPGAMARMVAGQALALAAMGIAVGAPGALALAHLLRSLLFGVSPADPLVFGGAALFLLAVSTLAGHLPARRAARIDPCTALRND